MLKKANRTLMYEDVAQQIIGSIRDGSLAPGSRLPGESELTELFGVSRNCLREALKSLGLMGLTYSRAGQGTFVSPDVESHFQSEKLLDALDMNKDATLSELWETRLMIEPELARLAAAKASPSDKQLLVELTRELSEQLDLYKKEGKQHSPAKVGVSVHMQIAKIAHNLCLYRFLDSIRSQLEKQRLSIIYEVSENFEATKLDHIHLCEAICNGDGDGAVALMRKHLTDTQEMYYNQLRAEENN